MKLALQISPIVVISAVLIGCSTNPDPRSRGVDVQASIGKACANYSASVKRAYLAEEYQRHAELTSGLLKTLSRIPLVELKPCEGVLVWRVRQDGIAPYISVLIDQGYRLSRASSNSNQHRFWELAKVVHRDLSMRQKELPKGVVLVRSASRNGYRPYSGNVGYSVLAMTYSRLGQAQFARGAVPDNFLRLLELYRNCSAAFDPERAGMHDVRETENIPEAQAERCASLITEFNESFGRGRGALTPGDLVDAIDGGFAQSALACLAGEDKAAEMIADFEKYTECRRDEQTRQASTSSFLPTGLMTGTSWDVPNHPNVVKPVSDLLGGAKLVKETHKAGEHPDGSKWTQDDYEFERADGRGGTEKITVSEYTKETPGPSQGIESGTNVSVENSEGRTEYQYADNGSRGQQSLEGMSWQSADGQQTYQADFHPDGSRTEIAVDNATGDVVVIETDKDGNQTVQETNMNDPTGETETTTVPASATQPPDDTYTASQCKHGPDLRQSSRSGAGGGLGPWILPHPDAVAVSDSCLTAFFSNPPKQCPPSVALCIDPPPAGTCTCGTIATGPLPDGAAAGSCAIINCGPDSTCNPATGTCATPGGDAFPGISNPPKRQTLAGGAIVTGPPSRMRSQLPHQQKLWYPSANSSFAAMFGTGRSPPDAKCDISAVPCEAGESGSTRR